MSEQINSKKYQPVRPLQEDEYFNEEDGLIYCRKCHAPRQCRRKVPGGREIIPDILCRCLREDSEKKQKEQGTGLLLWGSVGSGKTFFAACIANALLEKKVPVLMTNLSQVLNDLTDLYSGKRKEYFDYLNRFSLLILDDPGIERNSDFAQEQIFNIVNRAKKKLIHLS